jgi:Membrane protein involved in colicin uptake
MTIDEIKSWIISLLTRRQRVTLNELLEQAESKGIGRLALFIAINQITQEERDIIARNPIEITRISIGNEEIRISLPQEMEKKQITRQRRQHTKSTANIMDVLFKEQQKEEQKQEQKQQKEEQKQEQKQQKEEQKQEQKQQKEEQKQEQKQQKEEQKQEQKQQKEEQKQEQKQQKEEQKQEQKQQKEEQKQEQKQQKEEQKQEQKQQKEEQKQEQKQQRLNITLPGFNESDVERGVMAIIQYLNKYWSVGRIRLIDDVHHITGIPRDALSRILDAMGKQGLVEIVEPGVVNKTDKTPVIGIKLSELLN